MASKFVLLVYFQCFCLTTVINRNLGLWQILSSILSPFVDGMQLPAMQGALSVESGNTQLYTYKQVQSILSFTLGRHLR